MKNIKQYLLLSTDPTIPTTFAQKDMRFCKYEFGKQIKTTHINACMSVHPSLCFKKAMRNDGGGGGGGRAGIDETTLMEVNNLLSLKTSQRLVTDIHPAMQWRERLISYTACYIGPSKILWILKDTKSLSSF